MNLIITKGPAEFNNSPLGNSKECLFVEFPNCISTSTNKSFKWMPTYQQLIDIKKELDEVEENWSKKNEGHNGNKVCS